MVEELVSDMGVGEVGVEGGLPFGGEGGACRLKDRNFKGAWQLSS